MLMSDDRLLMDMHAMQVLAPLLAGTYLPFSSASVRPSALAVVANDIVLHDRRRVLECGSGISTIVLGRLLAARGGRLVTIEHDAGWATFVRRLVTDHGLHDVVTIVEAPLAPAPVGNLDWYDVDLVSGALSGYTYDLLLVDGPPAWMPGHELARLPAVPVLERYSAASATVVLDDADRDGEREIIDVWERDSGLMFARYTAQGVAVAHVGDGPFGLV
jgi:predicted O-methyltransferase YrrM